MDVGRIDTTLMAKAMEKVMIKKDVKKKLKFLNIVGHVEMEEVDAAKNDTKKNSCTFNSKPKC